MKQTMLQRFVGPALLIAGLTLPAVSRAQSNYAILDLGTFGGKASLAYAISNGGQVVGCADTAAYARHAFLFAGSAINDVFTSPEDYSAGTGVNDEGMIVGTHYIANSDSFRAFCGADGAVQDIGTLGGTDCFACGLNSNGQIVGHSLLAGGNADHAFLYVNGAMQDLGTLGGPNSAACGINNTGQIVGKADKPNQGNTHAFLYEAGVMRDLGTLGGTGSVANGINNSGQIVGYSLLTGDTGDHAFLYSNGVMRDIGTLGGNHSVASSINEQNVIVGEASTLDGATHAFIYANGVMRDLNDALPASSGWTLVTATSINDGGCIVGQGTIGGALHAYLLFPNASAVSGRIALEGIPDLDAVSSGIVPDTIQISFRTLNTTTEVYRADVTLTTTPGSAFGTYTLSNMPVGAFDIAIKSRNSLRVLIPNVRTGPAATLPDVTLPAGDANGDNVVDIGDFGILTGAYGSNQNDPESGYDARADFNYDGVIDIGDFGLLVAEYGNTGAL